MTRPVRMQSERADGTSAYPVPSLRACEAIRLQIRTLKNFAMTGKKAIFIKKHQNVWWMKKILYFCSRI